MDPISPRTQIVVKVVGGRNDITLFSREPSKEETFCSKREIKTEKHKESKM